MSLSEIADVRLQGGGVMFQYLLLELEQGSEKRNIVRGLNYKPSTIKSEEQIVNSVREELGENGFFENGGDLKIAGGGSVALNLYYEKIILFGSNPVYGMEENREAVAQMMEKVYPDHEVAWFDQDPSQADSEPQSDENDAQE